MHLLSRHRQLSLQSAAVDCLPQNAFIPVPEYWIDFRLPRSGGACSRARTSSQSAKAFARDEIETVIPGASASEGRHGEGHSFSGLLGMAPGSTRERLGMFVIPGARGLRTEGG